MIQIQVLIEKKYNRSKFLNEINCHKKFKKLKIYKKIKFNNHSIQKKESYNTK